MVTKDKIFVVTGGAGSFGSVLVKRLHELGAKEVRVFSRNSRSDWEGDIRDISALKKVMNKADYVVHAAAVKDVHFCEENPREAIDVNVFGSINVLNAAKDAGVERIVFVSSDKACFPMGTMGITKALMEKMVLAECKNPDSPKCTIVRFGNLMGSAGTVIPLFVRLAREGADLTVTNPEMTRFMMTMQDAADLTLLALEYGDNGDIMVEKAKSATIETLAHGALLYAGVTSEKERKSRIKVTGARPGEKLYETMATSEEISRANIKSVNGRMYLKIALSVERFEKHTEEYNSHNAGLYSVDELALIIRMLMT
ncbi:MAG: polysaccharide biosynthesis protein [Bacteroidales bacterium]